MNNKKQKSKNLDISHSKARIQHLIFFLNQVLIEYIPLTSKNISAWINSWIKWHVTLSIIHFTNFQQQTGCILITWAYRICTFYLWMVVFSFTLDLKVQYKPLKLCKLIHTAIWLNLKLETQTNSYQTKLKMYLLEWTSQTKAYMRTVIYKETSESEPNKLVILYPYR